MTLSMRFLPEFFTDAERAVDWYERERSGLGIAFSKKLNEIVDQIAEMPTSFAHIDQTTRVAMIQPFPYGIYFRIENEELILMAVWHLHRKPGIWRQRKS